MAMTNVTFDVIWAETGIHDSVGDFQIKNLSQLPRVLEQFMRDYKAAESDMVALTIYISDTERGGYTYKE